MRKKQRNIYWGILSVLFVVTAVNQTDAQAKHNPKVQTAKVLITEQGYSRTSINLRRGIRARITFLRQTDATCATEVVISAYGVHRSLPLNTPTVISFTPKRSGEFDFTCGMSMMHGKLIVQ